LFLSVLWSSPSDRYTAARTRTPSPAASIPVEQPEPLPPRARPRPVLKKKKTRTTKKAPVRKVRVRAARPKRTPSIFSGFGAWVDQYDLPKMDPAITIAMLRSKGVQTLYLESGESSTPGAVLPADGPWLAAAHGAGIKVVAWYLPHYQDLKLDVNRMVAAARYTYLGQRFDGVGVDIEYRRAVRGPEWMKRVAQHMQLVRKALGRRYPLAAIPPTPLQMAVAPNYWAGFPWASLGRWSSEIMIMAYWTARHDCPQVPQHCAYGYTKENVLQTRQLTGGRVPIHVIGGVGTTATTTEIVAFVKGAKDARADGASIYDVGTTQPGWWAILRALRTLGR
jgi:hypothetical protein